MFSCSNIQLSSIQLADSFLLCLYSREFNLNICIFTPFHLLGWVLSIMPSNYVRCCFFRHIFILLAKFWDELKNIVKIGFYLLEGVYICFAHTGSTLNNCKFQFPENALFWVFLQVKTKYSIPRFDEKS